MKGSFWQRLDQFPPILIRLLARHNRRPLTTPEIAKLSGLTPSHVEHLSRCLDWAGIDIPTTRAFMIGCRMDITNRTVLRMANAYRTRPHCNFKYLRTDPRWQDYYEPLLENYFNAHRRTRSGNA